MTSGISHVTLLIEIIESSDSRFVSPSGRIRDRWLGFVVVSRSGRNVASLTHPRTVGAAASFDRES